MPQLQTAAMRGALWQRTPELVTLVSVNTDKRCAASH